MQSCKHYFTSEYLSPIGRLTLACNDDEDLVGLWIQGQRYFLDLPDGVNIIQNDDHKIFYKTKVWLDNYFCGCKPQVSKMSLAPNGSDFMLRVWRILCTIPYGQTLTYGDIAKMMTREEKGQKIFAAQAVGRAVGRNPISIIIPCHRVIGANGNLTGYFAGVDIKAKLLNLEGLVI